MGELIVILVIALIFLGPKRLPDVATSLGKAIRSFRKATRDLTDQLEIDDEVKAPLRELQSALRDEPAPARPLAVMKAPEPPAGTVSTAADPTAPGAPSVTAAHDAAMLAAHGVTETSAPAAPALPATPAVVTPEKN
jgi:sec-independent protein translocase protein TatB